VAAEAFIAQLNQQIGHEFAAHQQYVACAVYYDQQTMQQTAQLFFDQAAEERSHAMMMVRYLLDADAEVRIPALPAPINDFSDVVAPIALALEQEKRVTQQINELTRIAREQLDFASDQFMQWFIKEQVEEVSKMSDLLAWPSGAPTTSSRSRTTCSARPPPARASTRPHRAPRASDSHPEDAITHLLERGVGDRRQREAQHGPGVGGVDHAVVPEPGGGVVRVPLRLVLLADRGLEGLLVLGRPLLPA